MIRLLAVALALCLPMGALAAPQCLKTRINDKTYALEIAATPEQRETGLMNRKEISPCDGMAFFFPYRSGPSKKPYHDIEKFWMKNTLIPLDMIFIGTSGKIIYIATAKPLSEEPVGPDMPVATVIELTGGRAAKEGIAVGDQVHYELQTATENLAR